VFDVDDTLICDDPNIRHRFAFQPLGYHLYEFCRKNGIHIRIVTARAGSPLAVRFLMNQLRMAGYKNPPDETQEGRPSPLLGDPYGGRAPVLIFMEPRKFAQSDDRMAHAQAKREVRQALSHKGERIVLCMGDKMTDHVDPTPKLRHYLNTRFQPGTYYAFRNPAFPDNLCIKTPERYRGWPK